MLTELGEIAPEFGESRGKGQWTGRGAASLGLSGSVDSGTLNDLIRGRLPNGSELGTRRQADGSREHTGGWDLTFSAPKSVSVVAEISGDRALFRAHNDAVKEAVRWLEDEAAALRRNGWLGSKLEQTGNLVVALFQHDTSREQDPQLHTHALVLNATQRADGAWRSLFSLPLYEHQLAAGNVYRAALAMSLQRMGFEVERTHADGRFEVVGVPEEALQGFSTRRAQIEEKLAGWRAEGAEASERAALMTRSRKRDADLPTLRTRWNERARAMGFDVTAMLAQTRSQTPQIHAPATREEDQFLRAAVARLGEREAAFTHADLIAATLSEGMGRIDVASPNRIIERNARSQGLDLYEARIGERKAWTTPVAHEQERRVEKQMEAGQGAVKPAMSKGQVRAELKDTFLNDSQKAAVELVVSSPDQFVAIVGRPGTGKTTLINEAGELFRKQGFTLVGMAPNGAAAKELEGVGGLPKSRTIASQLARMGTRIGELRGMERAERAAALEGFRKEVWIVDEASQINNRDMRRLVYFAGLTGARVAFIGDPAQLGAINAGKPFERLIESGIRHVVMNQILRQEREQDRDMVRSAIDRDIAGAMNMLKDCTWTFADEKVRHQAMIREWSEDHEHRMLVTLRNSAKAQLNDLARDWLRQNRLLGKEHHVEQLVPVFGFKADRQRAAHYEVGDVVRFGHTYRRLDFKRDTYWSVTEVEKKDSINRLTLSNGQQTRTFNPREERNAMRHAEHFRPRKTTLAVNDRIVWNRPDPAKKLVNGDVLTVQHITKGQAIARTAAGTRVMIDCRAKEADQHWDHAYVTTLYKSQGKTADGVLVDAPLRDSALMDHHAFLVGVSRHRQQVRLYTDDPEILAERIIRNVGDKTSAVESRGAKQIDGLRTSLELVAQVFGQEPEQVTEMAPKVVPERKREPLEPDPRKMLTPDPAQRVPRVEIAPEPAREMEQEREVERSRGIGMGM